jgi:diguanylate cyclase (GGDEF)-like protein
MMDIDHFKRLNDEHGHVCGDDVLNAIGHALSDNMRGRDVVTRYGGEEFAVLMPETNIVDARENAEIARRKVEQLHCTGKDGYLNVTVSAGVAEVNGNDDTPALVKRADQAMYAAKHAGRNRTYWHDGTLAHPVCPPVAGQQHIPQTSASGAKSNAEQPWKFTPPTIIRSGASESGDSEGPETDLLKPANVDLDYLANMGNKTMFCQGIRRRIAEWNRGGSSFSVIMLTVDDFAELSRKHGDSTPQLVLGALAQALRGGVREMDLVARYSDSTFGLVLPDATLPHALVVGERLRKTVQRTGILVDNKQLNVTVSLGVVEVADGDEMATLVERAQAELARASSSGGNRSGFSKSG